MSEAVTRERLAKLGAALFADPALRAYAVVDGASRLDMEALLYDSGVPHTCLFTGALDPEVAAVAPYLVALDPGSPMLAPLAAGLGRAQAIFILTGAAMVPLRRHLRTLTLARIPDGRTVFFRFYDPRVLRSVVPLLTPQQRQAFFGRDVAAYLCEAADTPDDAAGPVLMRFARDAPAGATG